MPARKRFATSCTLSTSMPSAMSGWIAIPFLWCGRREKTPDILTLEELALLLNWLNLRERVAVFLDFGTGMRRGELQGCKWQHFDFDRAELRLQRSNVNQRNGRVKTEASSKPIPLSPSLISDLELWRRATPYAQDGDHVFASPTKQGKQ